MESNINDDQGLDLIMFIIRLLVLFKKIVKILNYVP